MVFSCFAVYVLAENHLLFSNYISDFPVHPVSSGSGTIWMDDVGCAGTEQTLDQCTHNGWGSTNCGHTEDIAIACNNITNGKWD